MDSLEKRSNFRQKKCILGDSQNDPFCREKVTHQPQNNIQQAVKHGYFSSGKRISDMVFGFHQAVFLTILVRKKNQSFMQKNDWNPVLSGISELTPPKTNGWNPKMKGLEDESPFPKG